MTQGLPFTLPERAPVTRIRQRDARKLRRPAGERTQPMAGFDDTYTDIVDYIVRITEEIWVDRQIGRIYDTYDHACTIYTTNGVVRSVEEVIASTVAGIAGSAGAETHHVNVAWSGDEVDSFYTSHLGYARSINTGASPYGPATGKRLGRFFVADCVSRDNRIHTEWLVRDNGAAVRQMGFDLHDAARRVAATPLLEQPILSVPTRLDGQSPRDAYDGPTDTVEGWVAHHFSHIWNRRRLDLIGANYHPDVVANWAGGRLARGHRSLSAMVVGLLASVPDATMRVEHVSWSEETDGVIVAARWLLEGTTRPGGMLGDAPVGREVSIMGMTHMRFAHDRIIEEWTMFDEVAVLAQAYRG